MEDKVFREISPNVPKKESLEEMNTGTLGPQLINIYQAPLMYHGMG